MRARQAFMDSLVAHGVDCIFGNPGTTESPLLDSLVDYPQIDYYVALHEGVAVCAASFYARASKKTALANLHVAPGLGNAIGMIYGALKANSPLIVTAGQQDTRMRLRNPLLSHDLVAMAAPVTKWSAEIQSADEMAPLMRRAFKIANEPPAGPVFVSLPIDVMEQETEIPAQTSGSLYEKPAAAADAIEKLVELILSSKNPAIIAGDDVAVSGAHQELAELAEQTGASVYHEALRSEISIAKGHPNLRGGLLFEAGSIRQALEGHDLVMLIGGPFFEEVWFDAVDAIPEGAITVQVEESAERLAFNFPLAVGAVGQLGATLALLASAIADAANADFQAASKDRNQRLEREGAAKREALAARSQALWDTTPMSTSRAMHEIGRALPEDAVVVDESVTALFEVALSFRLGQPGDYYAGRGGGIGQGLAGALGVKVAHPDRPVVALSGDGSAMYSIQALWTAAHHDLDILFVIISNREYRVLKHNLDTYRQRFDARSDRPYPHMDLSDPVLGFVEMARGMGVQGKLVSKPEELHRAVQEARSAKGPYLLDVVVAGKR
ncbi:MAG: thiamine pyrophosphate-binding protein [Deltaproteobacteria bacterium]|nr:thiamine pyrophosphate-binding protein [Deltaproteobacteria bacterium]